jgi:hypothetical protein
MSLRRAAVQILSCIVTGLVTGALLMLAWHGIQPTLELGHAILLWVYGGFPLSP